MRVILTSFLLVLAAPTMAQQNVTNLPPDYLTPNPLRTGKCRRRARAHWSRCSSRYVGRKSRVIGRLAAFKGALGLLRRARLVRAAISRSEICRRRTSAPPGSWQWL